MAMKHQRQQGGQAIQIKEGARCHPEFTWRLATALLGIHEIDDPRRERLGHPMLMSDLHQVLQQNTENAEPMARPLIIGSHTVMSYSKQKQSRHINIHDNRSVKEAEEDPATGQ
eukprot:gene3631-1612_t